jgi:hypothetical protein
VQSGKNIDYRRIIFLKEILWTSREGVGRWWTGLHIFRGSNLSYWLRSNGQDKRGKVLVAVGSPEDGGPSATARRHSP